MNMNPNWIEAGIMIAIVTLAGGLAVLYRRVSSKRRVSAARDLSDPGKQYSIEIAELRDLVIALQSKVEELAAAEGDRAASPAALSPHSAINMNKRSEALRMYNRGGDTDAVHAALGIPRADAVLLRKVQRVLSTPIPGTSNLPGNSATHPLRPATLAPRFMTR
jgi:hypothetical protein